MERILIGITDTPLRNQILIHNFLSDFSALLLSIVSGNNQKLFEQYEKIFLLIRMVKWSNFPFSIEFGEQFISCTGSESIILER